MRVQIPFGVPAWRACRFYGHADVVQLLMDYGAHTDACDSAGCTSLHLAASGGHLEVLEAVIGYVEVVDDITSVGDGDDGGGGGAAIGSQHSDYHNSSSSIVGYEYDPHCDVNRRQRDGASAFFLSAQECHTDCMELLARCGADVRMCARARVLVCALVRMPTSCCVGCSLFSWVLLLAHS